MFLPQIAILPIHLHCMRLRWSRVTWSRLTTGIWKREIPCTMHSVWLVWHFPMHSLALYIPWHIRQVQRLRIMAHTSSTAQPMQCICRRLSHLMQRMRRQRNVTVRLRISWNLAETHWMKRWSFWSHICAGWTMIWTFRTALKTMVQTASRPSRDLYRRRYS